MIEITKDLIEACFREANVCPISAGEDLGLEMVAWSTLIATLGVIQLQTEKDVKSFVINIRDFFIDDMGEFRSSRRMAWDDRSFGETATRWAAPLIKPMATQQQALVAVAQLSPSDEAAIRHLETWSQRRSGLKNFGP